MASLVGQQLKDTYDSLLKTSDNDALGGTYKEITDGAGNGSNLYLGTGGNVGIGTSSPATTLDVASGNSGGDPAQDAPTLRITNTTQGNDWDIDDVVGTLEYFAKDTSGNAPYVTSFIKSVNETNNGTLPSGALTFGTATYNASGGAVERLRIDSSGNVGIGTSSPSYELDIDGDIRADALWFRTNTATSPSATGGFYRPSLGTVAYGYNGNERLRITSSGNVGIGTATPDAKLHIEDGDSPTNGAILMASSTNVNDFVGISYTYNADNDLDLHLGRKYSFQSGFQKDLTIDTNGYVGINTDSPAEFLHIANTATALEVGLRIENSEGHVNLNTDAGGFEFETSASGTVATIDSSGNVGIGTDSPSSYPVAPNLVVDAGTNGGITVKSGSSNYGGVFFADGTTGNEQYRGFVQYNHNYAGSTDSLLFGTSGSEAMRIDSSGNLLIGTTATPTSSAGNIVLTNGTAPTGNATNGVILYAEDVSTSSELKVRDEAGNVTTLSPHNFSLIPDGASEPMAWAYYSERDGKKINVDMLKLARMVESLTGEKLVYEQ